MTWLQSLLYTPSRDWNTRHGRTTTCLRCTVNFIGYESRRKDLYRLQCSLFAVSSAMHRELVMVELVSSFESASSSLYGGTSIKWSVSRPVLQSLVVSMVLTRLDYGSATLAGLLRQLMDRLQSLINAAALLAFSARRYDHITPLLREHHS